MKNLEEMTSASGNLMLCGSSLMKEQSVRKREVTLSRTSVYIVLVMVTCHMVRIIPTMWEIVQSISIERKVKELDF